MLVGTVTQLFIFVMCKLATTLLVATQSECLAAVVQTLDTKKEKTTPNLTAQAKQKQTIPPMLASDNN